jgi:CheY-like chemotaxis protein
MEQHADPWILEFTNPQIRAPMRILLHERLVFGRIVQDDPRKADIDLSGFNAAELGVSRLHFAIEPDVDRLALIDLGSENGLFLNNERLTPQTPYRLNSGDQIMAGRLKLDLSLIVAPVYGGSIYKQPSLQISDQTSPGQGEVVLLVMKDVDIAGVISPILTRAGYKVKSCHDVVTAIRMYTQRRPEVIIVDPELPDMNGLEFCRYVRRDVSHNTTPLIVLRTSQKAVESAEAIRTGADFFLERPISARELRHVISALIYHRKTGEASLQTKHLIGTAPLTAGQPEPRRNACVLFVAGKSEAPIVLAVQQPVSLGRQPTSAAMKMHVDLSRFDAANLGVSRVHALLHYQDDNFAIEDQDTINGTYLNGDPLKPRKLYSLKNADEIRLGQLRLFIYFLEKNDPVLRGANSQTA